MSNSNPSKFYKLFALWLLIFSALLVGSISNNVFADGAKPVVSQPANHSDFDSIES